MPLEIQSDPKVSDIFKNYPDHVKPLMLNLRDVIIRCAQELDDIDQLEETLTWGEPSYKTKIGSTLRMDWKAKNPERYALYFQCTSRLVSTFKMVFNNTFTFDGNRALIFDLTDPLPLEELKHCIKATLKYHKIKHLPTLGI